MESHLFGEDSQVGLPQMTVEQGDYAIIHFYNLEDLGGDEHSFTLIDGSYNINKEFAPQENGTITFNANLPWTVDS